MMLTIKKHKEILELLDSRPGASSGSIASKAGVSRAVILRIRDVRDAVSKLGDKKTGEVKKLILNSLPVGVIMMEAAVSKEEVEAVRYHFCLQPRRSGRPVDQCPTCGSMMFSGEFKTEEMMERTRGWGYPKSISRKQATRLYLTVVDLLELNRLCIITNPLFFYLAKRAEEILGEIHVKEANE